MNDPYSVLGVSRQASLDEVKKAYRDLARKYHPDNYVGNELADLAQEKMKEINEAYDIIVKEKESGGRSGSSSHSGGWSGTQGGGYGPYIQIRSLIQQGLLAEADRLLEEQSEKSAEWYFCKGSMFYRKGWYDEAARYWQTASSMEPGNAEYRQASGYARQGPQQTYRQPAGGVGFSPCDCCSAMICADCLCNGGCC